MIGEGLADTMLGRCAGRLSKLSMKSRGRQSMGRAFDAPYAEVRRQQAASQAAALFIAAGVISLCYDFLSNRLGDQRSTSIILDSLTVGLGIVVRSVSGPRGQRADCRCFPSWR